MDSQRTNPYVGLRPFYTEDSLYFFGREKQTGDLLEILHKHRFLGIVGSSGSGKSSLVRAGLLPNLFAGFLVEERDQWHIVTIKPGDSPLANFASGFIAALGENTGQEKTEALEKAIRDEHSEAVTEYLKSEMGANHNLLLLVDQFEEIFSYRGIREELADDDRLSPAEHMDRARRKSEANDFVELLLTLAAQNEVPIYVTLTMRTDFLGDCDLFYGLPEALNQGRYLVPRMTRRQMRDAIECPALLKKSKIAPRLLDYLLNEVGDRFDRLPVLQHALQRTWDEWLRKGGAGSIEMHHYETAGGLKYALDKDAEEALRGLDKSICAAIFKRLTDTDNSHRRVRSPARVSELMTAANASQKEVEGVVLQFKKNGRDFVYSSADGDPEDPSIDISHESLIRQWDRLRVWVDEERRSRDRYKDLVTRAKNENSPLLWPPELHDVTDWKKEVDPQAGWADRYSAVDGDFECTMGYIDKSIAKRCNYLAENDLQRLWRKKWHRLIILFVVVLGIVGYLTGFFENLSLLIEDFLINSEIIDRLDISLFSGQNCRHTDYEAECLKHKFSVKVRQDIVTFGYLIVLFVLYIVLSTAGKKYHRWNSFPLLLERYKGFEGRTGPVQNQKPTERPEATIAQNTEYAPTIRRIGGYIVDNAISVLIFFLILSIWFFLYLEYAIEFSPITMVFSTLAYLWLYPTLQLTSKHQATVGMRTTGIFMTDLHGQPLSFSRATSWWLLRLLSYLFLLLGFFIQPFREKLQTFHDQTAEVVVLRRQKPTVEQWQSPVAKIGIVLMRAVAVFLNVMILGGIGFYFFF